MILSKKHQKFICVGATVILGLVVVGLSIYSLTLVDKHCKSVECELKVNRTFCEITYENTTCTCDHGNPDKDTTSNETCYIYTQEDDPCPELKKTKCMYMGNFVGGVCGIILGGMFCIILPLLILPATW